MKTLYLRELRRLSVYGLLIPAAVLGYGALGSIGASTSEAGTIARTMYFLGLLLPALLGVAAVAPDTSSGATAFFARLPLTPRRALLAKITAATTWLVAGLTLIVSGISVLSNDLAFTGSLPSYAGAAFFCFGAGLLASVVAARSMPAVLITPTLGITGLLLGIGGPYLALGIPFDGGSDFGPVVICTLGVAFVGVAFLAYTRGDRHRSSFQPALLALAALAPLFVLGLGATTAAHAWSVEATVPTLEAGPTTAVASPDGSTLAVPLSGRRWTGDEHRVALVSRADQSAWVVPVRHAGRPEFLSDGRLLLRNTVDPGGWVVEGEEVTPLYGAAAEGFGFTHVLWVDDQLVMLRDRGGWLEAFDPTRPCDYDPRLPPLEPNAAGTPFGASGWEFLGVCGAELLLAHREHGLVLIPVPELGQANPSPLRITPELARAHAWPPLVSKLRGEATYLLSANGRQLLVSYGAFEETGTPPQAPSLYLLHVTPSGQAPDRLQTVVQIDHDSERELSIRPTRVSWSPNGAHLAYEYPGGGIVVFETTYGRRVADLELGIEAAAHFANAPDRGASYRVQASRFGPVVWSPEGRFVATPRGVLCDLLRSQDPPLDDPGGSPAVSYVVGNVAALLDDHHTVIPLFQPLATRQGQSSLSLLGGE